MKYPGEITTRRAKMAYWYFKQAYTFFIGKDRIVGRFVQLLPEITIFTIAVDYFGLYDIKNNPVTSLFAVAFCVLCGMISCWITGRLYMKYNLDRIANIVNNERNTYMQELYANMVKKKKRQKY